MARHLVCFLYVGVWLVLVLKMIFVTEATATGWMVLAACVCALVVLVTDSSGGTSEKLSMSENNRNMKTIGGDQKAACNLSS